MSHTSMTRWIEAADARQFSEATMFDRRWGVTESHYLHLGDVIAHLPSWFRYGVSRESLTALGCHALAVFRHPHERSGR
jgi:hypothetical protein